jgi:hypothetical protein
VDDNWHGRGTYYYASTDKYEGEFFEGAKTGYGKYYFNSGQYAGDRYEVCLFFLC